MFSQEIADAICARLAEGEPLKSICKSEDMPSYTTVRRWEVENEVFRALSTRAREAGCHAIADDCMEIADDGGNDWMKSNKPDNNGYAYNGEHVQRSKLRIETRMRLLGKWLPKVYGEKVSQEITGANGGPIEVITRRVVDPKA